MVGESPGEPSRGRFHALGVCDCWGEPSPRSLAGPRDDTVGVGEGVGSCKARCFSALGRLAPLVKGLTEEGRGWEVGVVAATRDEVGVSLAWMG